MAITSRWVNELGSLWVSSERTVPIHAGWGCHSGLVWLYLKRTGQDGAARVGSR